MILNFSLRFRFFSSESVLAVIFLICRTKKNEIEEESSED